MSLPSQTTVSNLTNQHVVPTWFPKGLLDQFVRKIAFERVDRPGENFSWNRATALPTVATYAVGGTLSANAMDTTKITGNFFRIGDMAEVDVFHERSASRIVPQLEVQVGAKKVGVIRALGLAILEGNGTAFEGLKFHVTSGQTIGAAANGANGGPPTLAEVHKLLYMVTASDGYVGGGATCLVAAPKAVRFIINLLETASGGSAEYMFDNELGGPVLRFNGIPVYVGQNSTVETKGSGTNLTSIWALKLGGPTGVRVLHSSGESSQFGIEMVDVPLSNTVSKKGRFVGGHYSLFVPEEECIARLEGCNLSSLV